MAGYTKLFSSIIASTIWREDDKTRIVWITMLAMSDKNGIVEASVPGLADFSRVTVEEARAAVAKLEGPDPDSRTPDFEGRRIEKVEGGWRLLNHAKYRAKLNADDRREYLAKKQREFRERHRESTSVINSNQPSTSVAAGEQASHRDATPSRSDEPSSPWEVAFGLALPESLQTNNCLEAAKLWLEYKRERKESYKPTGLKASLSVWAKEFTAAEFPSAVEMSMARSWMGVTKVDQRQAGSPQQQTRRRNIPNI